MLVWCVCSTEFSVVDCGIADARKRTVTKQVRYVTQVASVYLLVSIGNGGIGICGIFELEDAKGYAVDKQQHIGYAYVGFHSIAHLELINRTEYILSRAVKIYILYVEHLAVAMASIAVSVTNEVECVSEQVEVGLTACVTQVVDDFIYIFLRQVGIAAQQIFSHIVG